MQFSFLDSVNQPQHQNVSVPQNGAHVVHSNDKEHMCTVVYFDDCMSIQCKNLCTSMGASKYRWFHNACCECVGSECIDYGSKTVKCMNCMVWRPDLSPSQCFYCINLLPFYWIEIYNEEKTVSLLSTQTVKPWGTSATT